MSEKQVKHWEQKIITYVYNHCNICNISIYFCNINMKHLQHISQTSETLKTDAYNMHLTKMEARRHRARRRYGAQCHRGHRCGAR